MQVQTKTHTVEILTADYQISGKFDSRGNVAVYLNDPTMDTLGLSEATLLPLSPGSTIGEMQVAELFVPIREIQVMFMDNFTREDAALLPNQIRMVCFTDTYVIRASIYAGTESKPADVFSTGANLLPVTDVDVYTFRPMMTEIGGSIGIAFVNETAIKTYHLA